MMLNDKNDCIESIAKTLERTSAWRKSLTARWPDDPRNARASTWLDQLAADVVDMSDAQWEDLKPYYSWASESWRNGLNQSTKQIGFYHRSGDLAFFIEALVRNLSPLSSVAA
ncbi:hypothetical protein IVB34_14690 [Bradyrhizobium sp. 2]|uniref:hypothetical protein n=1 Tax=Bradyrhizobium sp. 2 TaxID=190045 RepID=UPI001FF7253C|nr:hypothetical protein [Bradyrhizobium sp. 2]MCK1459601.1 hypothetical protein [Bradyrhizobium sp. 2]